MTKEQEALQKFTKIFNINPIPMSINNLDGEFIQINKALMDWQHFSGQFFRGVPA